MITREMAEREHARFQQRVARLHAAPEVRARILASATPFDYEAWLREAGPARAEELAEMEELLREREEERKRDLACREPAADLDV